MILRCFQRRDIEDILRLNHLYLEKDPLKKGYTLEDLNSDLKAERIELLILEENGVRGFSRVQDLREFLLVSRFWVYDEKDMALMLNDLLNYARDRGFGSIEIDVYQFHQRQIALLEQNGFGIVREWCRFRSEIEEIEGLEVSGGEKGLSSIYNICFADSYGFFVKPEDIEIANGEHATFYAFDRDRLVGFVMCDARDDTGVIKNLGVVKEYRHRGIASFLLKLALIRLKKTAKYVHACFDSENLAARKTFSKFGFKHWYSLYTYKRELAEALQ